MDLVQDDNGRYACNIKRGTPARTYYVTFYHYYDATIYSYLPLSSMLVFNTLIVAKLISARLQRKDGALAAGSMTMSKVSDSVSKMLVACSMLFAVTTTPYAIMYNVNSDVSTLKYALMIQGIYINHSANIIIYLIFNPRFRSECRAIFCGRSHRVAPGGTRGDTNQPETMTSAIENA